MLTDRKASVQYRQLKDGKRAEILQERRFYLETESPAHKSCKKKCKWITKNDITTNPQTEKTYSYDVIIALS